MAQEPSNEGKTPVAEDPALDSLEERLAAARKAEDERLAGDNPLTGRDGQSLAWQVASPMLGYPLGGIIVGFLLDRVFGTTPWITIVLMFTAFAGACIHVVRNNKTGSR